MENYNKKRGQNGQKNALLAPFGQYNGSSSFTGSIFEPGIVLKCLQTPSLVLKG